MSSTRRGVAVLGSTGSVGCSTLDVLGCLADQFDVVALAAGQNQRQLQEQIDRFQPRYASLDAQDLRLDGTRIIDTDDPLVTIATLPDVEIVVVATTGHAAIPAVLAALRAGKIVALANKEAIVAAGHLVMQVARESSGTLRPVDSEHSALWQSMGRQSFDPATMRRLVLTGSGGPFRSWSRQELEAASPAQALKHPNWSMGAKITIDSATLMNKGFELIEAIWLFDCPLDAIDVVIHPQSIVHSMVEFHDGSFIAQLGSHDMRIPIQYALTAPARPPGPGRRLRLEDFSRLDFEAPDDERFPAITVARQAAQLGSTYPTALSASDEIAVGAFLDGQIRFTDIVEVCRQVLEAHEDLDGPEPSLEAILEADRLSREAAQRFIERRSGV